MLYRRSDYVAPRTLNEAFGPYAHWDTQPDSIWFIIKTEFWRIIHAI